MKGIVLAGGSGTRLSPLTSAISKQLLPVYDKPMIYYPISILMLCGIQEILIISTPKDLPLFERLLGDGSRYGVSFCYREQLEPKGLPEAFLIGEHFISQQGVTLVLGDNIFYGARFVELLKKEVAEGANIFGHRVADPSSFGVVQYDECGNLSRIMEKPSIPPSDIAVTGLYQYDDTVADRVRSLVPSRRNELEISDLNNSYLADGKLNLHVLPRGTAWLDTGTHDSLLDASQFVKAVQNSQGLKVACLEEIAFRNGWIGEEEIERAIEVMAKTTYGKYLGALIG